MTSARRGVVVLLLAVLLFAALSGQSNSAPWWAILAPAFLALGLIALAEDARPYLVVLPAAPSRLSRAPRGPPLK